MTCNSLGQQWPGLICRFKILNLAGCRINPALAYNAVKFKEKGLLYIEQSSNDLGENPVRSGDGRLFEYLMELAECIFSAIFR